MKYAGFWRRALALLVDVLVWLPFIGLFYLVRRSPPASAAAELASTGFFIAYAVYMHGRWGQTVGKMAARIQVRMVDGSGITWRAAWLRSSVDIFFGVVSAAGTVYVLTRLPAAGFDLGNQDWFDLMSEREPVWLEYTGYLGIAWVLSELVVMLTNKKRRALHDFIAGTVVVRLDPRPSPRDPGGEAEAARPA